MFCNIFHKKKQLKNHPKIKLFEPKYLSFSGLNFDSHFWWKNDHFGEPFWHPGPPRDPFFGQNGVTPFEGKQFFSKVRSVVPLWAPKVTPRVAQGPPKAAPRSLFGHFWTTLGHFLVDFDHFRAPFRSLLLAFGDVLRVSLISVDFYAFPAKFLTFPLKFLTFSSWKVWNILAVWIRTSKIFCRKFYKLWKVLNFGEKMWNSAGIH